MLSRLLVLVPLAIYCITYFHRMLSQNLVSCFMDLLHAFVCYRAMLHGFYSNLYYY